MPKGSLKLPLTDLCDAPIIGDLDIDFAPAANSAGGDDMDASFAAKGETEFTVTGISCLGGPGTLYRVRITTGNFRPYAFFQRIFENRINPLSDSHIRLVVNPKRVADIEAPAFEELKAPLRGFLDSAEMQAVVPEDRDLLGLTGAALYDALGPLRKACLLNLFTKASHGTSDKCFSLIKSLKVIHQDRCFCSVDQRMPEVLRKSERFKSAPKALHKPLKDFVLDDSFKTRDAHANLQVTFMRDNQSGELAADVDIDEASGIEHGFEVIRNAVTDGDTNPYLVRELMLLFDPVEKVLDPGYRFQFKS